MASLKKRLSANVPGDFYVDETCINCGTCRFIAPDTFNDKDKKSRVYNQPETEEQKHRALMAVISCPTSSIGTEEKHDLSKTMTSYPDPIDENIFHCGFHSKTSFGATSYFIKKPEGNVMVDSPRFVKALARQIEEMGGVKYMFLSHRDDVADHRKYHEHFGCERIMHADEVTKDTEDVERIIQGLEPIKLEQDMLVIPVPGHTKGSMCLLYRNKYLFSGDHLAMNPNRTHPTAFNNHCWYSWTEQIKSMKKIARYRFEWILPGHSLRCHFPEKEMAEKMKMCIDWMEEI